MKRRPFVILSVVTIVIILAPLAGAQQEPVAPTPQGAGSARPFTQDQVRGMVRDGLGDETGARAIEQRSVDFAPSAELLRRFKAGADLALLQTVLVLKSKDSQ